MPGSGDNMLGEKLIFMSMIMIFISFIKSECDNYNVMSILTVIMFITHCDSQVGTIMDDFIHSFTPRTAHTKNNSNSLTSYCISPIAHDAHNDSSYLITTLVCNDGAVSASIPRSHASYIGLSDSRNSYFDFLLFVRHLLYYATCYNLLNYSSQELILRYQFLRTMADGMIIEFILDITINMYFEIRFSFYVHRVYIISIQYKIVLSCLDVIDIPDVSDMLIEDNNLVGITFDECYQEISVVIFYNNSLPTHISNKNKLMNSIDTMSKVPITSTEVEPSSVGCIPFSCFRFPFRFWK